MPLLPRDLRLAVFDLAGTTLNDMVHGQPLAVAALCSAFARAGLHVSPGNVTPHRGLNKRDAIRRLVEGLPASATSNLEEAGEALVEKLYGYFTEALAAALERGHLTEVSGTSATFEALRARNIKIVISSGFAEDTVRQVVARLGWQVDGIVGAQRPRPDAIFEAMEMFHVTNPSQVLKVGDTVADVQEGLNAGVYTVAVLTGSQREAELRAAGPDLVIGSVAAIAGLLPPSQRPSPQPVPQAASEQDEPGPQPYQRPAIAAFVR